MIDFSATTTALLVDLRNPQNQRVWSGFDARYRPIILGVARRLGLGYADAADVAQDTLAKFLEEYQAGKYDRSRGRLRHWLMALARTRVLVLRREQARRREINGQAVIVDLPDEQTLTELWEAEKRIVLLRRALVTLRTGTRLNEKTIQAFELLMVQQMEPAAVAAELHMTTHDVYLAKGRVARRLREIMARLERQHDAEE